MRQVLYVSDSLIGDDPRALNWLLVQAQNNNLRDGITGLLWTDGRRFAQVLEGEQAPLGELLVRIRRDPRHESFPIVRDVPLREREMGRWSMHRAGVDDLAAMYQRRLQDQLRSASDALSQAFLAVTATEETP